MSDLSEPAASSPVPSPNHACFPDFYPSLTPTAAIAEANRCLFCFDAPCMTACPTHIDVTRFIKKIATGNLRGSAQTILDANILGASCSRACPVQVLCEGACVLHHADAPPIQIALLQRHAMEHFHASGTRLPFTPAPDTGKRIALIGAGPASLACAAELRRYGHAADIYDARSLPGGLNTYGIAEYKLPLAESLREIDMIARLGVRFHFETQVTAEHLAALASTHDAVFLGMGLGKIHTLGVPGEHLPGVTDALTLIAQYKTGTLTSVPSRVAVIGAGNTAIDAAIAARRLGADEVYCIHRRGEGNISAFAFEFAHAKEEGVRFLWHQQLTAIEGTTAVERIQITSLNDQSSFKVDVGMVILAIGQATHTDFLPPTIAQDRGRILIDRPTGQTSDANFFAGGDCTNGGREVVDAVADGKRAAQAIHAKLSPGCPIL